METMDIQKLQGIVDRSPLNRWLGMRVESVEPDSVTLTIQWREELISSPERQTTHGGILATLVDGAGDYAVAARIGRAVPTLDLHVDYHRPATPGDLRVIASVVHMGSTTATARAQVFDQGGRLLVTGRGLYFVAQK
ncbi:PaaI family thioesterase [Delftia tsuruhatensis]|uniref:PaaI family thioesterase n=1 Tax=Delftia tsuruhatensis TaxID=180282 RepID=UPI003D217890